MNIILIGMSGAGKSTLGVLLAKALGLEFIDTDIIIQNKKKQLLQEIITNQGIDRFLAIEERIISKLDFTDCVVATGGSVIYSKKIMSKLKSKGQIIYLAVSFTEIKKRLKNIKTRGIVIRDNQTLQEVYRERVPLYEKYSDKTIDCTNKDIESCINEIITNIV